MEVMLVFLFRVTTIGRLLSTVISRGVCTLAMAELTTLVRVVAYTVGRSVGFLINN